MYNFIIAIITIVFGAILTHFVNADDLVSIQILGWCLITNAITVIICKIAFSGDNERPKRPVKYTDPLTPEN